MVRTFIRPERVFVWRSKERAPKAGRIGNLEKGCGGLEKSCHHWEKSGKMLEKKFNAHGLAWATTNMDLSRHVPASDSGSETKTWPSVFSSCLTYLMADCVMGIRNVLWWIT